MITVRELGPNDEDAFLRGVTDWAPEDLTWHTFDWKPGMTHEAHLDRLAKNRRGEDMNPRFVPSTMFYGFNEKGEIIGRVSVRHHLNEHLQKRGGHIGYAVAQQFRRKGYATELLRAALTYARDQLRLKEVMISCADDNPGSYKTIEKFGGRLIEKIYDNDEDEMIRKYSVQLTK